MKKHINRIYIPLIEQNMDIEQIVAIIKDNKSEHKRILCNFAP